jgi:hypothetical protein
MYCHFFLKKIIEIIQAKKLLTLILEGALRAKKIQVKNNLKRKFLIYELSTHFPNQMTLGLAVEQLIQKNKPEVIFF